MAPRHGFSQPLPTEASLAILAITQGVAHLGLFALRSRWGVTASHWVAAAIAGGVAWLVIALLERRLRRTD